MVTYDSKTKTLVFKKIFIIDGESTWTQGVSVELNKFDEATRQFIIALAKQAINFANGHQMVLAQLKHADALVATVKPEADDEKTGAVKTVTATQISKNSVQEITTDKTE